MTVNASLRQIPQGINLGLLVLLGSLQLAWLAGAAPWLVIPLMLLATTAYWALIHEAIHGGLLKNSAANLLAGRALAVAHGAPFTLLRLGHLLHHRYSRTLDVSEAYDPTQTSYARAALRHYSTIFGGLYFAEMASGWLAWMPTRQRASLSLALAGDNAITRRILRDLERPESLRMARIDAALSMLLLMLALWSWGQAWWLFALSWLGRAALISFFDNAYHYGTPLGGKVGDVRNHYLPVWAAWLVLNFHWHGVHHQLPSASWIFLPDLAREQGVARPTQGYCSGALMQLKGPLPIPPQPYAPRVSCTLSHL